MLGWSKIRDGVAEIRPRDLPCRQARVVKVKIVTTDSSMYLTSYDELRVFYTSRGSYFAG